MTELTVSYSVGIRANLGNFEHGDAHVSRTEKWDVDGLDQDTIDKFYTKRREEIKAQLDPIVEHEYKEMLGK